MKETLLNRFKDKDVVLHIRNDPRIYVGFVIDIRDGALILNNRRYGVSTFDTSVITVIQEDIKNKKRDICEEIQNENETQ